MEHTSIPPRRRPATRPDGPPTPPDRRRDARPAGPAFLTAAILLAAVCPAALLVRGLLGPEALFVQTGAHAGLVAALIVVVSGRLLFLLAAPCVARAHGARSSR